MKKTGKSGTIATAVITLALLGVLSIITWVIPMPNKGSLAFLAAYICAMVLIFTEGLLVMFGMFKEKDLNEKILGLPALYFGLVAVVTQLVFTIVFYALNAFVNLPGWIVIVAESLLYLFTIINLTLAFFFKARTKEFRNNKAQTAFIDLLRAKLQIAVSKNTNKELEKELQDLFETARGTDPVTGDATRDAEQKLLEKADELNEKLDSEASAEEIVELSKSIKKLIQERAILCKLAKK